jgi:hypothetical protein
MTPEWAEQQELCQHGERRKFCALCVKVAPIAATDSVEWPEWMIEADVTKLLEQDGWRALRTDPVSDRGRGKGFGEVGMADYLYLRYKCTYGAYTKINSGPDCTWLAECQILWIEFKSCTGKPAKHQIEWHTKERARGALTWIASVDVPASVAGFVEHYRKSGLNRGRI